MSVTAALLRRLVWSALLLMTAAVTGCSTGLPTGESEPASAPSSAVFSPAPDESVAVVGGKSIKRSELTEKLLAGYGAEALRELMLREAVNLEAAQLGISVTDEELDRELRGMSEGYGSDNEFYSAMMQQLGMDRTAVREDARYRRLVEKLATRNVNIPEAEIKQYYDEHKSEYGERRQFQLAWILTAAKNEAERVLGQLEAGDNFADLAGRYSIDDATAQTGGDLGWVDEGDPFHDARLLSAAGALQVGQAAGPVKMEQGYAVIEMNGLKTTKKRDFSAVKEDIRQLLAMERAKPIHELEQSLLAKYHAQVLDPRLQPTDSP